MVMNPHIFTQKECTIDWLNFLFYYLYSNKIIKLNLQNNKSHLKAIFCESDLFTLFKKWICDFICLYFHPDGRFLPDEVGSL